MTYGQTSSGKTYTLFGGKEQDGLIPRFLKDTFMKLKELETIEDCQFKFKYSFFEIYKEKIFDMLSDQNELSLNLRENHKKFIYVENLKKKKTEDYLEVLEDLEYANSRRKTNETSMNLRSSRSHFIINFEVETKCLIDYDDQSKSEKISNKNFYEVKKKSQIIFIDLAGSEKQLFNNNEIIEEGCYINKSLSVLNHVIQNLSKKKKNDFIHYRDSKLTFFLKEIFKGNSHFSIIGNILPFSNYLTESLNTVNFVSIAKSIKTNPHINFQTKNNTQMMQKQIRSLLNKIDFLEKNQKNICNCKKKNESMMENIEKNVDNLINKIDQLKNFFFDDININDKLKDIVDKLNVLKKEDNFENIIKDLTSFENYFDIINFEHKSKSVITIKKLNEKIIELKKNFFQISKINKIKKYKSTFSKYNNNKKNNFLNLKKSDSCDFPFSKNKKLAKYHLDYISLSMFSEKVKDNSKLTAIQNENSNKNNLLFKKNLLIKKEKEINSLKNEIKLKQDNISKTTIKFDVEKNKFEKILKKKENKSQKLFKRISNLERQLRNRNKDYLFALKELEKNKIKAPPLSDIDFSSNYIQIV